MKRLLTNLAIIGKQEIKIRIETLILLITLENEDYWLVTIILLQPPPLIRFGYLFDKGKVLLLICFLVILVRWMSSDSVVIWCSIGMKGYKKSKGTKSHFNYTWQTINRWLLITCKGFIGNPTFKNVISNKMGCLPLHYELLMRGKDSQMTIR